jgi:RNA polymerase sigma-70 factor (ECF subfamily)
MDSRRKAELSDVAECAPQLTDRAAEGSARREHLVRPTFHEIFQAELPYVWNTLRRLRVRESEIEDVAHDVFVTVYRLLDQYDPSRPLKPWLFGVALRVAARHRDLARHKRELPEDHRREVVDEGPAPDAQLESKQERHLILEALEALDLDRRAVLIMHDLDGHAIPEVAAALSIGVNTAYSRLRLAREQFRATFVRLGLRRGEL